MVRLLWGACKQGYANHINNTLVLGLILIVLVVSLEPGELRCQALGPLVGSVRMEAIVPTFLLARDRVGEGRPRGGQGRAVHGRGYTTRRLADRCLSSDGGDPWARGRRPPQWAGDWFSALEESEEDDVSSDGGAPWARGRRPPQWAGGFRGVGG